MNLQTNLSDYIDKPCIIKASGASGVIRDYYRRRSGTGGLAVRFVVERLDDGRTNEYEPALLEIQMTEEVKDTK